MTRHLVAFASARAALALAALALPALAVAQTTFVLPDTTPLGPVERALLQFEQGRSAAIARHDTVALRRMYADEFRGITAAGVPVDRERLLGVFARDDPTTAFAIDELAVRALGGEAAMLSGRLVARRRGTGETVGQSRFLHVYTWRDGRWQILAAQGTAVRD